MKKRNNRFLAGTLAGLMMLTMLPVTALAAEEEAAGGITTLTEENGAAVSGNAENNIVNVVSDPAPIVPDAEENTDKNADENGGALSGNNTDEQNNAPAGNDAGEQNGASAGGDSGSAESGEASDPTPAPEPFVAKIGTETYDTLDAAVDAVQDGETIELGDNCTLTVGMLTKAVEINGKGFIVTVPEQETENHALNINAALTIHNTKVKFTNDAESTKKWSATMNSSGVLTLTDGSICTMEKHGIYASSDAVINVLKGSKLLVQNTSYTALMAEPYAVLNIEDGSELSVDRAYHGDGVPNGINNFKINVVKSELKVTNCESQGLVRCWLTLDDSDAEISGNDMGITGYANTNVLIMTNESTLLMKDNIHSGIFMYGGIVDVQKGSKLTITGTGKDMPEADESDYYVAALASYNYNPYRAHITFADGATVKLIDNAVSAIKNGGKLYLGSDTTVTNNGSKTSYGGGIQNYGAVTVSEQAQVYNNHAKVAGDDIYSSSYTKEGVDYAPSLLFSPVGDGWVLDDCGDPIVGWYQDGAEKRWNGDGEGDAYYADEYIASGKEAVADALALKAAHGKLCTVTYEVTGDIPSDAGNPPAAAKVKMGGNYTVAPAQTTSQSRYTFSGWRVGGVGDIVTSLENVQQDVKLVGVWTRTSSGGGGGGGSKPTVDIPDDVPTGLNGDDHFAYIVGYPDGNVQPSGNITRAEVATIFFRLLTEEVRTANSTQTNSLSDVSRGQWFNHAVSTLSSMGIVKGHTDGSFAPNAPITRAEFAAIAARFDDKSTDTTSNFSDISSHWAKNEIGIAANKGWINGYPDGTFRPNQYITRAEAMTLVNRVLNRLPEQSEDLLDEMIKWPDNADNAAWYYLAVQEATNSHDYADKNTTDKFEKWTTIRDARDWTLLEK